MATIKSYTDIEQAKKLAEILPLESADMYYSWIGTTYLIHAESYNEIIRWRKEYAKKHNHPSVQTSIIPCWSLAALLNVIPNNENISTNLSKGGYRIPTIKYPNNWFVDYEDETNGLNNCATSADNPIDACYELILKLHELKML